jgi:hypothetical protein
LFLPRLNPALSGEIEISLPRRVQQAAAVFSLLSMAVLIVIQLLEDAEVLSTQTLRQRIKDGSLTSVELILVWGLAGVLLYQLARMQRSSKVSKVDAHAD